VGGEGRVFAWLGVRGQPDAAEGVGAKRSEGGVGGVRWECCLISEVCPAKGEWGHQQVQVHVQVTVEQ
jgi:hypothetical protein